MGCPQCGTELGAGAKACGTCGWKASKKTLWIVLGCIAGFFLLVCCGIGTVAFLKMKKAVQGMQGEMAPLQMIVLRAQVANYAQKKGKPPATLEEAASEPILSKSGERVAIDVQSNGRGTDVWGHPFRFSCSTDRTFQIRCAGPNGQYEDADDVVEKGTLDDDVPNLLMEFESRKQKMGEGIVKSFGIDPEKIREEQERQRKERMGQTPAPAPPPGGAPAVGTQGGAGGK